MALLVQGKTNFRYIFIVLILALLVGGGILWWIKTQELPFTQLSEIKNSEKIIQTGIIEGSLGYPSDFIPADMKVCAENTITKKQYCTDKHIKDTKYTYGEGYKIEVPVGNYYVFATIPSWGNYRAYYSEFITCGLSVKCLSHEPILITVKTSETVTGINPQDWYKPLEEIIKDETANWQTYRNEEYGFEMKYPLGDWTVSTGYCSNAYFGTDKNCVSINYAAGSDCSVNIIVDRSQYDNCLSLFSAKIENVNFAGTPAFKNPSINAMGTNYCVQKNNNYFTIFTTQSYISPHRNPEEPLPPDCPSSEEEKILSTFRFIE